MREVLEEGGVGRVPGCGGGRVAGVGRILPRSLGEPGRGGGPDGIVVVVAGVKVSFCNVM